MELIQVTVGTIGTPKGGGGGGGPAGLQPQNTDFLAAKIKKVLCDLSSA
jgi:hypothetical protein